ncbi:MAG: UDP binding domain-containing protein, partial [Planctomycetota bacterium]
DVTRVRQGEGRDARIGQPFLVPGIGYGGSCFPKDVKALIRTSQENGYRFRILEAVEVVNENQKRLMLERLTTLFGESLEGRVFGVWGLAFKPKTDDMRESPAIPIIRGLLERGARVRASDPEAFPTARRIFGDSILYCEDPYEAIRDADGLILCTEWNEFRHPSFEKMKSLMKRRLILDGRNIYSPKTIKKNGFERYGVGIPAVESTATF